MSSPKPRPIIIPIHVAPPQAPASAPDACCTPATAAQTAPASTMPAPSDAARLRLRIDKMDCPTEERLIRTCLEPMAGVLQLDFNLLARELTVHHRLADHDPIIAALVGLDMAPTLLAADQAPKPMPPAVSGRTMVALAASGASALGAEALAWTSGQEHSPWVAALAALSIACAGGPTLKKGWIALRHLTLNIYFLMTLAVMGAALLGEWAEAAMVVSLFALAEAIEALSLARARQAVASLSALAPDMAEVWHDGHWHSHPVDSVALGSRIRVRAGERVPLDSVVLAGQAALNQAPITGESLPVDKGVGAPLYAGSIVSDGILEAEVTATAGHSTLARIAQAINQAQAQRAPTQRFVDTFARYYTPAVVALACAMALLGPLLTDGSWQAWLYQALVMLVIACPCALVVSTPVTVVSGLAAAARAGILIKGGAHLEGGRLLRAMALDKTGTLTAGRPALTDVVPLQRLDAARALLLCASLDEHSSHPIARAIVAGWRARHAGGTLLPVQGFAVLNGRGVKGEMAGQTWHLGNQRLAQELGHGSPALEARLDTLAHQGRTGMVLMDEQGPVAVLAVADTVRPQAAQAIARLKAMGLHVAMLTGDNEGTAQAVAGLVGITDVQADLLPEGKLQAVGELATRLGAVGMVGDGVNDAPALARAQIGFAMGAAGTATALDTADVAIMDDDLRKVGTFIALSRQTAAVLKQNIALALGIKAVFLALSWAGMATLWMAVFADMGASLLVVFNGLRLLRARV